MNMAILRRPRHFSWLTAIALAVWVTLVGIVIGWHNLSTEAVSAPATDAVKPALEAHQPAHKDGSTVQA